ncbi:eukaryotic aspartyl protease, partial [Rhizoctonia solani 123E]
MSGIPTQEYHGLRVVGNATQPQTIEFSILMCDPRLSVDTREVRLDGTGKITVMESKGLTRQGNLHLAQTRLLVGKALTEFSSNSGPKTMYSGIGQAAQIQMFFGPVENSTLTPVLTPRPIEELTHGYMVAQQAAMRSYLSGRMASSFVPGRKQKMILAFTSSLPQVIVSTILFIFATIFINLCHLRSDAEQFTLFSVAAALSHSNLSRICEAAKYGDGSQETLAQDVAMKSLENRRICLINNDGPGIEMIICFEQLITDKAVHARDYETFRCPGAQTGMLQETMIPHRVVLCSYMSLLLRHRADAAKTWATLPTHAPPRIEDSGPFLHGADVALGTPPQNTTFILDTTSPVQHALTPDCVFCPTEGMYDMSASSSLVKDPSLGAFGDTLFGGSRGYESITLGGLLQDSRAMVSFVDQMSPDRYIGLRFAGGKYLTKKRVQSIIHNLNEQGQLLNPVWGLRLGGENPQLTIGALDPKDYEGEINWVPVLNDSYMIQIDALKGYNGNAFPLPSPLNVLINSVSRDIYVPDLTLYYMNESLVGPQEFINIYPKDNSRFGILCNGTKPPSVEFSVEINGIDYPVNPTDMIRPPSGFSATGFCNVGVVKSSLPDFTLGITFLRSVYL